MSHGVLWLDRFFGVSSAGSSWKREVQAGFTTFLTMAYILFVNPQILSDAIVIPGVDVKSELLTATALAACVGSIVMGLLARYPFALAPGMGLNAYFAYSVVLGRHIPWQQALGAVFLSGVVFAMLSVAGIRERLLNAIPYHLKIATTAGIGLFLAVIGCRTAGWIAPHPVTLVTLGDVKSANALLAFGGLVLTAALLVMRVRGAFLLGILATTIVAHVTHAPVFDGALYVASDASSSWFHGPVWPTHLMGALDIVGALDLGGLEIVFVFLFVDLFDTAGTLFGLAEKGGFLTKQGTLPRAGKAFLSDAIATCTGSTLGCSTTVTYIESAAGIEEGGRTGLVAVVVGCLFALAMFCSPLMRAVPAVAAAATLVIVGAMMMASVNKVDWDDYLVAIPACMTIITMPLTYSIANGISFGILVHCALYVCTGRVRQVNPVLATLAVLLISRYVYLSAA